jgi:hypothetical protein
MAKATHFTDCFLYYYEVSDRWNTLPSAEGTEKTPNDEVFL